MSFQKGNNPPHGDKPRSLRIRQGREGTGSMFHTPKISRARLVCLGNKALATRIASFTFLLLKAFLACLVIYFLMTSSALRLTPRDNPAFNPLTVLLGSFNGFRVLLRPWRPPRIISVTRPLPLWPRWSYHSSVRNRVKLPPRMLSSLLFTNVCASRDPSYRHRCFFRKAASNPFLAP